jgi:hypothetical protein
MAGREVVLVSSCYCLGTDRSGDKNSCAVSLLLTQEEPPCLR